MGHGDCDQLLGAACQRTLGENRPGRRQKGIVDGWRQRVTFGEGCDMLLVCDTAGRLVGVLTKTDAVRQTGRCAGASCTAPVIEAMTRDITTVTPDGSLRDVWDIMKACGFKNIPIIDANHHPLGVLNARDVLQTLRQEVREEENLLHDYVMNIGYR